MMRGLFQLNLCCSRAEFWSLGPHGWFTFLIYIYNLDIDWHTRTCLRTICTRNAHLSSWKKTAEKHFTQLKSQIYLERCQHKHHASSGRCWDSLSNAISDVITGIKTCRLVKQKMILHALSTQSLWISLTVLHRRLADMLGICMCLCAVFSQGLSQETEEPVSYTVSERFLSVFYFAQPGTFVVLTTFLMGSLCCIVTCSYKKMSFVMCPSQCTEGYKYDKVREQCRGETANSWWVWFSFFSFVMVNLIKL